jgi:transposase InsO family protein
VYTDHKPLKSLFLSQVNNIKIQRWSTLLAEHSCKIEYRKGSQNIHADMLSRLPNAEKVATVSQVVSSSAVGAAQRLEFPQQWEDAEAEESGEYIIEGDELFSVRPPHEGAIPYPRLLAPLEIRNKLLEEAHNDLGQRGRYAMLRHIQSVAVWPKMQKDIKAFLLQCPHCQGNKRNERPTAPMITDTPSRPFEKVAIDLTGPFLPSPAGNKYVLVVLCHLTAWAEVYPIPDKRSITVWKKLESEFFPRYGFPKTILSDMGLEFNANFFRQNLRTLGIEHRRSTPGHPQTNGAVERFNRTLKDTLRKLCNNETSQWEKYLVPAIWAYRASEMETRGSSPYYMLFGQLPNGPSDRIQGNPRFELLARAQRHSYEKQEMAKRKRQEASRLLPIDRRKVKVGDVITIDCAEPVTFSHLRDHSYRVVSTRGKVIGYVPLHTSAPGKVRYINIDRVRTVPDIVSWQDINPRVRRNRTSIDVRTLPGLPTHEDPLPDTDEANEVTDAAPPPPPDLPPVALPPVAPPGPRRSERLARKRRSVDDYVIPSKRQREQEQLALIRLVANFVN